MSGMLPKSQVPWMSRNEISAQERTALIHAKQGIREGAHRLKEKLKEEYKHLNFHPFDNEKPVNKAWDEPSPLPDVQPGHEYVACYLPHPRNPEENPGSRRLVFECHKSQNRFTAIYYTADHYKKFTFWRIE